MSWALQQERVLETSINTGIRAGEEALLACQIKRYTHTDKNIRSCFVRDRKELFRLEKIDVDAKKHDEAVEFHKRKRERAEEVLPKPPTSLSVSVSLSLSSFSLLFENAGYLDVMPTHVQCELWCMNKDMHTRAHPVVDIWK
jgi:hypothetical protein